MSDPYLYPGTNTLKNKFNEKDEKKLSEYEADFTSIRMKEIYDGMWKGNFDYSGLCELHYYIFQDVYEWAGQARYIDIEKYEPALNGLSIEYTGFTDIKHLSESTISKMKNVDWDKLPIHDKAVKFSSYMAELWKIHPFREGNTRTIVTFCSKYADGRNIALDTKLFQDNAAYLRTSLVAASAYFTNIGDKRKPEYLIRIVEDSMQKGIDKENRRFIH